MTNNLHIEWNDLQKSLKHLLVTSQDLHHYGLLCKDERELTLQSVDSCAFGWDCLPVNTGNSKPGTLEVPLQRRNLGAMNEKLEENRGKYKIIF